MKLEPTGQALDYGERPDPARGIFETVAVVDGGAPLLAEQLERLNASARELYAAERVAELGDIASGFADGSGRLRVAFVPEHGLEIDHGPRPADPLFTAIAPFVLPGGLGKHKWLDRTLLDAIDAAAAPQALPLLIDADGSLLESTRMNVLIEERGRLISPPSDGRFRAGFGRTRLHYDEEPVDLDRLLGADAVVLTSALRVVRFVLAD